MSTDSAFLSEKTSLPGFSQYFTLDGEDTNMISL